VDPYDRWVQVWVRKCASFDEDRAADREFWAQSRPSERVVLVEA
jgi:hypothetical protein